MRTGKNRRRFLEGFLEQEKTPVFTAASMLTTVLGWIVLMMDLLTAPHDWTGPLQLFLLEFVLLVGSLINAVMGGIASSRGEYCGGRIAALGTGLWFLTVVAFSFFRGHRLWS